MALITLDHVSKIYPHASRPALDKVDLSIDRGEFVFLVGASGAGKSTLLSLLLREEEATEGDIRVAGNDLRRMPNRHVPQYRRTIGFVFQDYKLLENKTVYRNVAFALEVIGTKRSTIRTLVPQVLEAVGLKGKEDRLPHELSGGEVQRVAIARAYVNHPQIILADEPTGNLDPTTSVGIMEVLDAINRTGTTIVMATHNEEIVNSMRKRVVELHNGTVVRDERKGGYDSSVYFPDEEVEANSTAQKSAQKSAQRSALKSAWKTGAKDSEATGADDSPAVSASAASLASTSTPDFLFKAGLSKSGGNDRADLDGTEEDRDAGLRRLARNVHSGNTGRYSQTFQSVEDTLTWGKGLMGEESERKPDQSKQPDQCSDQSEQSNRQSEQGQGQPEQRPDQASIQESSNQAADNHEGDNQEGHDNHNHEDHEVQKTDQAAETHDKQQGKQD